MLTSRRSLSIALASAALAVSACQTNTPIGIEGSDSGSINNTSPPDETRTDASMTSWPSDAATQLDGGTDAHASAPTADDIQGVWTGYFENFMFASGSDAVRLTVGKDAQGQTTLAVVLGTGTPPAPPTDPTKSWPIQLNDKTQGLPKFFEGYSYPTYEVSWADRRLRFKLASKDPYGAWCGLQTSYAISAYPGRYNCVPGIGGSTGWDTDPTMPICTAADGETQTVVPCGQYFMCGTSICSCGAAGCGPNPAHDYTFDVTFSQGMGNGSAILDSQHNVHVSRN